MTYSPKILVIDDEPLILGSLEALLNKKGYEINLASTGKEGIKFLNQESADLVLLDIGLPDMDGYQVMDHIGENSPHTLVIVMTGHASIESAVEALRKGAYNYLRKPFEYEELLRNVKNALDHKRSEVDRLRAEETLREREELLRMFVEHTPAAVAMFDSDMRYLAYSRRWLNDYDLGDKDLLGQLHYDVFPEIPKRWKQEYAMCFSGEVIKHDEELFPRADGTVNVVRRELYPWKDSSGKIGGIIVFLENITDRKKAEEDLRESEERFRALVEDSPIGIIIIQKDQIVYQNPEQKKLFGPLAEILEKKSLEYIHMDDLDKVKNFYANFLSNRHHSIETDFRFYPPDKKKGKAELRWVQCKASSFKYGREDAILVNMVDITRSKELEHLVTLRSKMASLGRIAAGIAHEIRNPLTGINSYLYSLRSVCNLDDHTPESISMMSKIFDQIQVASNKIESVIKRVLDFSKPSMPKMILGDITEPIKEAINLSAVTIRKSGIKMKISLAENLPKCYVDPNLIEQVILNLINNATRALEKSANSKKIEILSRSKDKSILISVSDSGPGVPEELRGEIFDPFFTTETDGSGIGLSIAQRIITDHNGSIRVETGKWGGAEFIVELPIERRVNPR